MATNVKYIVDGDKVVLNYDAAKSDNTTGYTEV